LPPEPLINGAALAEFDTLVVDMPARQEFLPPAGQSLLNRPSEATTLNPEP
jgi:hypothetical protein